MLTVRWIKKDIGYEEVFQVLRVWIHYGSIDGNKPWISSDGPNTTKLCAELSNGDINRYDYGDFYIMNDHGKTVADYHFICVDRKTVVAGICC